MGKMRLVRAKTVSLVRVPADGGGVGQDQQRLVQQDDLPQFEQHVDLLDLEDAEDGGVHGKGVDEGVGGGGAGGLVRPRSGPVCARPCRRTGCR